MTCEFYFTPIMLTLTQYTQNIKASTYSLTCNDIKHILHTKFETDSFRSTPGDFSEFESIVEVIASIESHLSNVKITINNEYAQHLTNQFISSCNNIITTQNEVNISAIEHTFAAFQNDLSRAVTESAYMKLLLFPLFKKMKKRIKSLQFANETNKANTLCCFKWFRDSITHYAFDVDDD